MNRSRLEYATLSLADVVENLHYDQKLTTTRARAIPLWPRRAAPLSSLATI